MGISKETVPEQKQENTNKEVESESESELSSVSTNQLEEEEREIREAKALKGGGGVKRERNSPHQVFQKVQNKRQRVQEARIEGGIRYSNDYRRGSTVVQKNEITLKEEEFLLEVKSKRKQTKRKIPKEFKVEIKKEEEEEEGVYVEVNFAKRSLTKGKKELLLKKGFGKEEEAGEQQNKPKKKRKTKEEKEAEMLPLAIRTEGLKMFVGAHVSIAKGVHNAIHNTVHIGGNAFALFLKSQRKWASPPLNMEHAQLFRDICIEKGIDPKKHVMPHGSYLVNLSHDDPERFSQAYNCFLDDVKRCESLGIGLYNFHPGSTLGKPREDALARVAKALNSIHKETSTTKLVLENMAGHGNIIGSTLLDLAEIIAQIDQKERIGVCIDTCHAFAAGYDLRTRETAEAFWKEFDNQIGAHYLSGIHLNDSKAPFNSKRDLHCNIGEGFLGLETFRILMNTKRLEGIPLILETPMNDNGEKWSEEIKLLEWLIGKDGKEWDKEVEKRATELSKRGRAERERIMAQVERRLAKAEKAEKAEKKKNKKITKV